MLGSLLQRKYSQICPISLFKHIICNCFEFWCSYQKSLSGQVFLFQIYWHTIDNKNLVTPSSCRSHIRTWDRLVHANSSEPGFGSQNFFKFNICQSIFPCVTKYEPKLHREENSSESLDLESINHDLSSSLIEHVSAWRKTRRLHPPSPANKNGFLVSLSSTILKICSYLPRQLSGNLSFQKRKTTTTKDSTSHLSSYTVNQKRWQTIKWLGLQRRARSMFP